jgi:hypothetical protein
MPAQECIRLNNVKGLFPKSGTVGEQKKSEMIAMGNLRSLYLPVEDNQLLTKESIFDNQIGATAGQV